MNLKITALPKSFQIDMVYYPIGESFKNILLIVDIQSRKAWAYLLSKSVGENTLVAYKKFISEVGQINAVQRDNQFSYKGFVEYNNDKNIRVDTEHISQGNKLGILDRLVRTLKEMIDRYRISVSKQTSFTTILEKVIITYNSQPHRKNKSTPNEMYNDIDKQNFIFDKDKKYNRDVLNKNNISIGDEARILEIKIN
jgi:hypothetical protein